MFQFCCLLWKDGTRQEWIYFRLKWSLVFTCPWHFSLLFLIIVSDSGERGFINSMTGILKNCSKWLFIRFKGKLFALLLQLPQSVYSSSAEGRWSFSSAMKTSATSPNHCLSPSERLPWDDHPVAPSAIWWCLMPWEEPQEIIYISRKHLSHTYKGSWKWASMFNVPGCRRIDSPLVKISVGINSLAKHNQQTETDPPLASLLCFMA